MPLQDLPCLSLQGSMLTRRVNKRKSRGFLVEGLDTECTPTDLIQEWSPPHKHQRFISKGKENDCNEFVLARRSRRKKESTSGRRNLSDLLYRFSVVFHKLFINCHSLLLSQAFHGTTFPMSCFSGSSSTSLCTTSSGCPPSASAGTA